MSEDPYDKTKMGRSPHDRQFPGYCGFLNRDRVTIAEVLKQVGYHTYMAGQWHLGMDGMEKWPLQRGFDRFLGDPIGRPQLLRTPRGTWIDS